MSKRDKIILLAVFMGYIDNGDSQYLIHPETNYDHDIDDADWFKYDTSWDWLMAVIDKITIETGYTLVMAADYSYWNQFGDNPLGEEFGGYETIGGIFEAVVSFVEYNKLNTID